MEDRSGNQSVHRYLKQAFPGVASEDADAEWALARWIEQRLKIHAGKHEETNPMIVPRRADRKVYDKKISDEARLAHNRYRVQQRRLKRALQSQRERVMLDETRQTATDQGEPQ